MFPIHNTERHPIFHRSLWVLFVLAILLTLPESSSLHAVSAKEAARYFQEGRFDDALEIYRQLSLENPDDSRYTYNAGVAAFKAGQYAEAMEQFDAASLSPDLNIQQQSHYNMGNTLYRAGESTDDFEQKTQAWKQAVQRYQHALTINEADTLAQDNLDFVKKRIEELQQQQQEQEQQNQENEQNEDQNEEESSQSDSQNDQDQDQNQENQSPDQQEQQDESQQSDDQQEQQDQQQDQQQESESQEGEENPQQQQPNESNPTQQDPQDGENSTEAQEGKMTPEQAKQLLDAERDQAKAMIFRPPEKRQARNRSFKDW